MWTEAENKLYRRFLFKNFKQAMQFMQSCALIMDRMNHHAEWKNIYNRVEVWLCTHDAGNTVTEKDRNLAAEMDLVFNTFNLSES